MHIRVLAPERRVYTNTDARPCGRVRRPSFLRSCALSTTGARSQNPRDRAPLSRVGTAPFCRVTARRDRRVRPRFVYVFWMYQSVKKVCQGPLLQLRSKTICVVVATVKPPGLNTWLVVSNPGNPK